MYLTVTLNTAVDKTYTVPNFSLDRVHRPCEFKIVPGGKGINVSRVLHELGVETIAFGFAGGFNGKYIRSGLDAEGIPNCLVDTKEESRVCITIIDPANGTQTELNENGPLITSKELSELEKHIESYLGKANGLILSGSIPPGVPTDIYARWIDMAKSLKVWTFLDTSGQALAEGLLAQPDAAKPNAKEISDLAGREIYTTEESLEIADCYVASGVGTMLISMGRSGALVTNGISRFRSVPPEINFVSAVGSGDAFVAGFVYGRHHGYDMKESLRWATAAGAANAMSYGAGFCSMDSIKSLAGQVEVLNIAVGAEV